VRAVVQRVRRARVSVEGRETGSIDHGLLVLLGCGEGDGDADLDYVVSKVAGMRIFSDVEGKMNLDVQEAGGRLLVVSQFTLYGDLRRGRRPGFSGALVPDQARAMVDRAVSRWRALGLGVETGEFGADMQVELTNDGPVTILVDSRRLF
jgi:D-tyrosyl-tRNA(Tyr) deacylase